MDARAVAEQDVLWFEPGERALRREQAEQRVDAEGLALRAEVAEAAQGIGAHEDPFLREPEGDLLPVTPALDRARLEQVGSLEQVERHAKPRRHRCAVAFVAVEQLDDSGRLAELTDPLVETRSVDGVRQPDTVARADRVRGARDPLVLERPGEAVLELVAEFERHGKLLPVATENGTSNAEMADKLESFAALLDLAGSNVYTSRAYRRAAEMIRETKAPVADLVRAGRVRELRGIGPGIEARLKELVETGRIAELDELESEVSPELVGLGRLLGFGPKRAVEIGRALGVRTVDEFREAAAAGRLKGVPGIGPKTEAKLLAALARGERPRPREGMLLNRALALGESFAEALGGEMAGDPRRWRDVNEVFAVVCVGEPAPLLDQFERLPQIVSVVERSEHGAIGVTVEGVPVELVVAEP